ALALPAGLPELPATLADAERLAENNYQVRGARFKAHSAAARAEATGNAVMPQIGAFAEVRRAREPQFGFEKLNDTVIGISISIPMWGGGSRRAESPAAHDKQRAARLDARAARDNARRQVVAAWQHYAASESALAAIKARVAAARTAYAGV